VKARRRVKNERRLSPPPGRSARLAFYQRQNQGGLGSLIVVLLFCGAVAAFYGIPLARVSWIWFLGVVAMCAATAALLIWVGGIPDTVVVGADWMKVTNGQWVDTTRVVAVEAFDRKGEMYMRLRDADGRHLGVRFGDLFYTNEVWETFVSALETARRRGDVKIDPQIDRHLPRIYSTDWTLTGRPRHRRRKRWFAR
jgi:hypothetical protein